MGRFEEKTPIRLQAEQVRCIRQAVAETFGERAKVYLFGSRADPTARGGDIDLLVVVAGTLSAEERFRLKLKCLARLYRLLGERKIDLIVIGEGPTSDFEANALRQGVRL